MARSWFRSICLSVSAALVLLAAHADVVRGQESPEGNSHGEEAIASAIDEGIEAATGGDVTLEDAHHAGGHGDVDYNKPPLPGSAPGLGILFIYSLVLFGAFLFIARATVWKPLIAALDEREGRINAAYAEAEKAKAEAALLLETHDSKMSEVQEQVKGIVARARQQAEAEKSAIISSAEAEAQAVRERSLAEIAQAREDAVAALQAAVEQQVGLATEHILGHQLN